MTVGIHQFHSGSAVGDAVTNSMLLIQNILISFGFVSEIFAEHVAPELKGRIVSHTTYRPDSKDVMFIHHSMGHEQTAWILQLPVEKILVYHNITPPHFFPLDSPFHHFSKIGREQLRIFLPEMKGAIADSAMNARELENLGYRDVRILPLLVDIQALQQRVPASKILEMPGETIRILFVGRIAPHKCQHELVAILMHLRNMFNRPVQLILVGGYEASDSYFLSLQEKIDRSGLQEHVVLTGKVSDAELSAWYSIADVFVCMSEHEGFCVPLIEAMAFDLPVVAYKSTNIPSTMAGAGLVVGEKKPAEIAALLCLVCQERSLRRAIITRQRQRIEELRRDKLAAALLAFLRDQNIVVPGSGNMESGGKPVKVHYQVEGPFDTFYSLALVNRELASALHDLVPLQVSVYATEGPGDYIPDVQCIRQIPGLEKLYNRGRKKSRADLVIRNLYPPRVADMDGLVNFLYFAWEESGLPPEYVADFNMFLDGLPAPSEFVKKILIDNGVHRPIATIGEGFDHITRIKAVPFQGKLPDGYKFLHISSCFPRKGVDVLLQAFCAAFTSNDKVNLIIKTFPNRHNTIRRQVDELYEKNINCPHIEIIELELPASQIVDLYRQCDAFVAPSRGEGFGLPMAEAMWCGLPVITTGFGGQTDFCTDKTSWLIDYTFAPAKTHFDLFDSVWVEPDVDHLTDLLRAVWSSDKEKLKSRLVAAKILLEAKFTWRTCAERLIDFEKHILCQKIKGRKKTKLGWVSSWGVKCGIATYSKFLLQEMGKDDFDVVIFASSRGEFLSEHGDNVTVCWKTKNHTVDKLIAAIAQSGLDIVVIQFNWAFYALADLARLILWGKENNVVVVVMFHVTKDLPPPHGPDSLQSICYELSLADRLLVHGIDDLNRLKKWGLVNNVALFPHGVRESVTYSPAPLRTTYSIDADTVVIASYGFLLPHKGIDKLIEAFSVIKRIRSNVVLLLVTALYPEPSPSAAYREKCIALIQELGLVDSVIFETDFLADAESMSLLSGADLLVFPYQKTGESSSAAVRAVLPLNKPVVVTPRTIFQDVHEIVHLLPGTSAKSIATGINQLLADADKLFSKQTLQKKWLASHGWPLVARRLSGMLKGLVAEDKL